jgi:hypothetical protein
MKVDPPYARAVQDFFDFATVASASHQAVYFTV